MRILTLAFLAVALAVDPAVAQSAQPAALTTVPVAGMIQSFDGKVVVLKESDGSVVSVSLAPKATINLSVKKTLADIKPGDFIASGGTRGPDGTITANEIRIFPAARGEGQFPMAQPDQVMTNATVKAVETEATVRQVGSNGGAPLIKLTFHGAGPAGAPNCTGRASDAPGGAGSGCVGETEFVVPANVPVVATLPGDVSMLKPGAKASMNVTVAPDGTGSTTRITISE